MNATVWTTLIITAGVVIAVALVLYFAGDKLKNLNFRAGRLKAGVQTQDVARLAVKDAAQTSAEGSNKATIRSDNATVENITQTAKKNNTLDIGA